MNTSYFGNSRADPRSLVDHSHGYDSTIESARAGVVSHSPASESKRTRKSSADSAPTTSSTAPPKKAVPEDAVKHKPAVLPPLKKTSHPLAIAKIAITKQNIAPGRLFLRMQLDEGKTATVGDFSVSVKLTEFDSAVVARVAKKLERTNKKANTNLSVVVPTIAFASIDVKFIPSGQTIWSSEPGVNFVGAASTLVSQTKDTPLLEHFLRHYNIQTIDEINEGKTDVIIRGELSRGIYKGGLHKNKTSYALILRKHPIHSQCLNISLLIEGGGDDVEANQSMFISSNTTADDVIMGFGHRSSKLNAKGMEVKVSNCSKKSKHGYASEEMQEGSAGSLIVPHFVTASGSSFFLTNSEPSVFDLRHDEWYSVRVQSSVLKGTWIASNSVLEAIGIYSSLHGRMKIPMWTQLNGALLGLSGGDSTVRNVHRKLKQRGCPISGVVISDWTGAKPKSNRMWYNWVLERELYPNWKGLVDEMENDGINVGLYVNACLDEIPPHLRSGRRHMFGEAEEKGYLLKHEDTKKLVNLCKDGERCGVVDMTNQDAVNWFKETIISNELLSRAGASFWIAETNFDVPIDAKYSCNLDGGKGMSVVNVFSQKFAQINKDAIRDAGREGDSFFFANSGFSETPKHAATSLSDLVSDLHARSDGGMKAALNGIINGGISGFAIGHCAVSMAVPTSMKLTSQTREMICRWMEMMVFTTFFRTHNGEGSKKSSISAYDDDHVLDQLTRWSKVYKALASYREKLLNEAIFRGWPVVRHPVLHYPSDDHFQEKDTSAFMLGISMYVAPVMRPFVDRVRVYLPEGEWRHLWTGVARSVKKGGYFYVPAPIGEPPVFYSISCPFMNNFVWLLQQEGIVATKNIDKKPKSKLSNLFKKKDERDF